MTFFSYSLALDHYTSNFPFRNSFPKYFILFDLISYTCQGLEKRAIIILEGKSLKKNKTNCQQYLLFLYMFNIVASCCSCLFLCEFPRLQAVCRGLQQMCDCLSRYVATGASLHPCPSCFLLSLCVL